MLLYTRGCKQFTWITKLLNILLEKQVNFPLLSVEVIQPLLDQCSDTALTDVSLSSRQAVIFPFLFLNSSLQATPLSSAYNKTSKVNMKFQAISNIKHIDFLKQPHCDKLLFKYTTLIDVKSSSVVKTKTCTLFVLSVLT